MSDIIEKRYGTRINVGSELRFRSLDSEKFYDALCIDLSGGGVLFSSKHEFQVGEKLEVQVLTGSSTLSSAKFMVTVVRTERQENGLFKIGTSIEYDDVE